MVSGDLYNAGIVDVMDVLILVLVEDGLGVFQRMSLSLAHQCLNPCFSGGWSRRVKKTASTTCKADVLILVLVEDGLGAFLKRAVIRLYNMS